MKTEAQREYICYSQSQNQDWIPGSLIQTSGLPLGVRRKAAWNLFRSDEKPTGGLAVTVTGLPLSVVIKFPIKSFSMYEAEVRGRESRRMVA